MATAGLVSGYCADSINVMGDKELKKKLRNRQSAQRARDRQKARMKWLEREVAIVTMKNKTLQQENAALKNMLEKQVSLKMPIPEKSKYAGELETSEVVRKVKNINKENVVEAEDLSTRKKFKKTIFFNNNEIPKSGRDLREGVLDDKRFNREMICLREKKEFPQHQVHNFMLSTNRTVPISGSLNLDYCDNISSSHQNLSFPNNISYPKMPSLPETLLHEKAAFVPPLFVGQMFPSYLPTAYGLVPFFASRCEVPINQCSGKRLLNGMGMWDSSVHATKRSKVHSYESESSSVISSNNENQSV